MTSYLKDLVDAVAQAKCEELPSEFDPKSMSFGKAPAVEAVLKEKSGTVNGHDYVDLGLPSGLKWATCNVGASSPEEYGDYYAWGEVETKWEYTRENCKTYKKELNDISGNPTYDVARAKWGSSWRMPTKEEFQELVDECRWEREDEKGYIVTGPNGNSIFLPFTGHIYRNSRSYDMYFGYYWSSTPKPYNLYLAAYAHKVDYYYQYYGLSVRPVLGQEAEDETNREHLQMLINHLLQVKMQSIETSSGKPLKEISGE